MLLVLTDFPWPEREYRFDTKRRFRFDFAWPKYLVGVEVEGGTWTGGYHVRGKGYDSNCEKYNLAGEYGWTVLRYTRRMIKDGSAISQIERVLNGKT